MRELVGTRREFIAAAALSVTACRAGWWGSRGASREPLVYVGTYTNDRRSRGIYLLRMDPESGTLRMVGGAAAMVVANPSFLAVRPGRRFLYAVNEVTEFGGSASGAVSAFSLDPATGGLALLGQGASRGGAPCYVTVDRTGCFVLVANYVGGSVAVLPIQDDGRVGDATSLVQHRGRGPHAERQASPHAHCVILDPANRFALAADLGTDRVMVYRFDARAGTLSPADVAEAAVKSGAGPRHLAFHPDGRVLYVVNELDSTITAFRYDPRTGALAELQTVSTLGGRAGESFSADLHVHPSGRFAYASNRGPDNIAVFSVDARTRRLALVQLASTGGHWPRNFALDPTGRLLIAANQRSDSLVVFRVDQSTGKLTPTGARAEVPAPVCVRFV